MEEFLEKLYSYEYFGIYLIISIVVLILLFVIILFFGKKDQREREKTATLKLQQINNDAFKDESVMEKVEVPNVNQEQLENDTIIVPNISDVADVVEETVDEIPEPVLPQEPEVEESIPQIEMPVIEPVIEMSIPTEMIAPVEEVEEAPQQIVEPKVEMEEPVISPLLEKIEEKPLVFDDYKTNFEVPKIEAVQEVVKPVEPVVMNEELEVPTFNFDEIIQGVEETKKEQTTYTKGPEIFSSVYVPKKEIVETKVEEVPIVNKSSDEELDFELPTLKKDVVKETVPELAPVEEVKEEKIEMPILTDYNLDNLSGETYTIK